MKKYLSVGLATALVAFGLGTSSALAAIGSGTGTTWVQTDRTTNANVVVSKPTGTTAGDVLVAGITVYGGAGTTITAPSGWALISRTNQGTSNSTGSVGLASFYKIANTSEPSTYTWTIAWNSGVATADRSAIGGIARYTGVNTSNPLDVTSTTSSGNGTSAIAPSITTVTAGSTVINLYGAGDNVAFTQASGSTERFDVNINVGGGANGDLAGSYGDFTKAVAGSTGTKTATVPGTVNWTAHSVALRPDIIAPTLSQVTPVLTPSNNINPSYRFNSSEAGTITYGGSCTSPTTVATAGDNAIIFHVLAQGTYSNCTITVTDAAHNASTPLHVNTFTIDTTAPVITLVDSSTVAVEYNGTYTDAGATATDNVDVSVSVTTSGVVHTGTLGQYILTYTATDTSGNHATPVTRTVNVVDTTAPIIASHADVTVEATSPAGAVVTYTIPNSSDNVDGSLLATCSPLSGTTFVFGTTTVSCNKTDSSGNQAATTTFSVFVVDTTKPVITLNGSNPQTILVGGAYSELGATVTDNFNTGLTPTIDASAVNISVVGSYSVKYDAVDSSGNNATEVLRTVNVVDQEAPIITLTGANPQNIEVNTSYTELGATVTDNYDNGLVANIDSSNVTSHINALGSYTVTYTAQDSSGNGATTTRAVNVVDTTAPVITLTGSSTVNVVVGTSYTDAGATATDNYDESVTVNTNNPVNINVIGQYTVTYNAVDSSSNHATQVTRTVNVIAAAPTTGDIRVVKIVQDPNGEVVTDNTHFVVDLINGEFTVATSSVAENSDATFTELGAGNYSVSEEANSSYDLVSVSPFEFTLGTTTVVTIINKQHATSTPENPPVDNGGNGGGGLGGGVMVAFLQFVRNVIVLKQ